MIYFLSKTKITSLTGLLTLVWVMLANTVLGQGFIERTGDFGLNPFFSYNFFPNPPGASPSLADLDGDGDLELVVINFEGSVSYNINTGGLPGDESFIYYRSPSPFVSLPDSYSPTSYVQTFDSSVNLKFSFGDLDGDGDLDGITGNEEGKILIFINTGSRNNPLFSAPGNAPIGLVGISYPGEGVSFVNLADFDGDRDLDLLVLTNTTFHYLRNTGTTTNAVFEEVTGSGNPFNGFTPDAGHGNPVVGDIDGDGDLDVALAGRSIAFYRNVGTTTAPVFVRISNAANPFNGITFSADDVPRLELGDMDRDNDLDLAGGVKSGKIRYFENGVQVYGQPTPASQTVCVGSPVSVTVEARGDGFYSDATQTTSLRYQWYRTTQTTATPVPGQTSATLSLTNVQPGDAGLYYVQATGSARYSGEELSVFSDGFTLTVQRGVGITQQPPSSSVVLTGTNVSVPVSVSGAVTGYQWYRNGAIVTGQTSATLTLSSVTSAQAGSYSLVATSSCNSVTSSAFSLTVLNPASVSGTKTVSGSFVPGGTATYTIVLRNAGLGIQNNNPGNEFTDVLPAGLNVSSASSSAGLITINANSVTWNGSIASNSQVTITITALVANGTNGQSISNQGSISFDGDANNTNESTVLTDDPTVEGSANPTTFVVNCPASTVTLSNDGPLTCFKKSVTLTTTDGPTGATYTYSTGAQASSASSNTATVTNSGPYSVTVTGPGGCSATATTIVESSTVTPTVSISPLATAICQGQSVTLNANATTPGGTLSYRWNTTATTASIAASATGPYSVSVTRSDNGCVATASASVTVNPLPTVYAVTGGGAYCAGSNGVSIGLSNSQTGVNYQLLRDNTPVGSPLAGTGNALSFGNQTVVGTYTVLATNSSTSCQQAMNGSATVTITPLPSAPSLVTANGYPYPAGVSSLTISQNVGPASLTVVGCSGGILMGNGNAASSFTISTAMTGTQTYTATCTQNGCTGPAGSFQLTVLPTTLSVLHRDADYGNLTNNIIKPYLELANAGVGAIPYSEVTLRYWFTSEGQAPPTNLAVYYAQLGAVNMKYVALAQPLQGAYGYVEYSFPSGGSLNGGGNSGPIENGIQKTDGSNFDESDDYSYQANYQDYLPNMHITAYRNGTIFYGQEPTSVASVTAVQAYTQAKDSPTTSQIQTRVELRNTGNVALAIQDVRIRYYFISDNNQVANVYVDYADIGASNIQARVIKLPAPVGGADSYVELRTVPTSMSLAAMSSLGAIDFRLVRSDNGLFDQTNDYSYAANYGNVGLNNRVTVLLNNRLIFGIPPSGAPARGIATEPVSAFEVRALGNPVTGSSAQVEITGVAGQAVQLRLVDLQGRSVHEQRIEVAGETESVSVPLGQSRDTLILKVSTDSQQQSLKLLRP